MKLFERLGISDNLISIADYFADMMWRIKKGNLKNIRPNAYTYNIQRKGNAVVKVSTIKIDPKINTTTWLSNDVKVLYTCIFYRTKNEMEQHKYESDLNSTGFLAIKNKKSVE